MRGPVAGETRLLFAALLVASLLTACSTSDNDDDLIIADGGSAGAGGTGGSGGSAGGGGSGGAGGAGGVAGSGGSAGSGGAGGGSGAGGGGAGGSAGTGGAGGSAGSGGSAGTGGSGGGGGTGGSAGAPALPPGLAGCVLEQNPEHCQSALESLPERLQTCTPDESGVNCIFNALYDTLGLAQAATALHELLAQCAASPAAPVCEFLRTSGGGAVPDRLPVASESLARGSLIVTPATAVTPTAKTLDGEIADWTGQASHIGGTAHYDRGEHIYSDYLFDAYGADDGDDARRLALTLLLGDIYSRTQRIDQLFQALGDQFGAPRPLGAPDHYGDAIDLDDGLDLLEVRWAASPSALHFLARTVRLLDASSAGILILADTETGGGTQGLNMGLRRSRFDRAVLLGNNSAELIDLRSGTRTPLANAVSVNANAYDNAIEAVLPLDLAGADGQLRVAVASVRRNADGSLTLANLAYRFDEPVAGVYNEREQALALFSGDIDRFVAEIDVMGLQSGRSESVRPGMGYHERIFSSDENISDETRKEDGLFQHYGLYVPTAYDPAQPAPLTFWLHYRGGKAHSGGAWTPRLITQLGEEQNNLVVTPRGRGTSTWYVTAAHQDFFEVFADAHALFPNIDPRRRYLSGYSMGGYATYLFGLLYPGLFAAGYSTSGAVTQGAWTGVGPDDALCTAGAQDIPEVGNGNLCFIEANDGDANAQLNYRLLENARHFPLVIHHGSNDELALTPGAERMGLRLLELGYRYDLTTFIGYEHYTQAIVDEWADGAFYLNLFRAPENPRQVTYKLAPALVQALNTVQARGVSFDFQPDGAYWVDGVVVRDANPADPTQSGLIEAESEALPGSTHLAVPRTGLSADPTYVSTPVLSPGNHSTPFLRHGQDWLDIGARPLANRFNVTLTRLAAATLNLTRMGLDFGRPIEGKVITDGASLLSLSHIAGDVTLCVNGGGSNISTGAASVNLGAGLHQLQLLPGHDQNCAVGGGAAVLAAQPDLGDLCRAYALEPGTALCELLENTHQRLENTCEETGGAPEVCSLFGGNLHALIDACFQNDPAGSPACKVADTFVQGAASLCRQLSEASGAALAPELCALVSGELFSASMLRAYEHSWTHRALDLQYELGASLPFVDTTFVATHNSFNATDANTPPTLSGSDANQRYGSVGQLRMGVRALEIDVHWTPRADGSGFGPTVCHGNQFHVGCTYEKDLEQELREIRAWMNVHPDQVVLLYLENNLNEPLDAPTAMLIGTEQYREAADMIVRTLGDILYTPANHATFLGTPFDCSGGHPLTAGIDSLRAAGKRAYIQTEGCDARWAQLVFNKEANGGATHDQGPDDSQLQTFSVDGICGGFTRSTHENKWTRYFEDGTLLGALTSQSNGSLGSVDDFRGMVRCAVNMPSMDHVTPLDPRLPAFIWSWAQDEPVESDALDCALHTREGRFRAADCTTSRPYACVRRSNLDSDPSEEVEWQIAGAGAWSAGAAACPAGFVFGTPGNGYQNELLKLAKTPAGVTELWLNYSDTASDGNWIAH